MALKHVAFVSAVLMCLGIQMAAAAHEGNPLQELQFTILNTMPLFAQATIQEFWAIINMLIVTFEGIGMEWMNIFGISVSPMIAPLKQSLDTTFQQCTIALDIDKKALPQAELLYQTALKAQKYLKQM